MGAPDLGRTGYELDVEPGPRQTLAAPDLPLPELVLPELPELST